MNAGQHLRPLASKHENGRIAVYVGATYSYLPRESALSLFTQLAAALDIPYSEGVALFAARVLHAHRGDGPGDVSSVDGGELQDFAVDAELVESFQRQYRGCGEGCYCEVGDYCLRLSPVGVALIAMLDAEPTPRELRL
ncbi:hypothetical protein HFP05_14000 [Rhodanobacter denitrificans]|nr:hypothetical protein [Rhodanobacter denitrificans]